MGRAVCAACGHSVTWGLGLVSFPWLSATPILGIDLASCYHQDNMRPVSSVIVVCLL